MSFEKLNLVSDIQYNAREVQKKLKNPWDIVSTNDSIWAAVNGTWALHRYTLNGEFVKSVFVVATSGFNTPTGLVKYDGTGFLLTKGTITAPSKLITVNESGTINSYNPDVDPNTAPIVFSDGSKVFKGCDICKEKLYVTNFASGFVEIYDNTFKFMYQFTDTSLTDVGYAPYNIKVINDELFVTFAKQDADKHDGVSGDGYGYVDVFSLDGTFDRRFANRDTLNEPWAIMQYKLRINQKRCCVILIGNFGNGKINIFTSSGRFVGYLSDCNKNPFMIDGLWGLASICEDGHYGDIYFAAGINDESDGLIGKLY